MKRLCNSLVLLAGLASLEALSSQTKRPVVCDSVVYADSHDVSKISLKDGRVLKVNYGNKLTYDDVALWKKGRSLKLCYSQKQGTFLQLKDNSAHLMVRYSHSGEDFIDTLFQRCGEDSNNRADLASCYHLAEQRWDRQLNLNYRYLLEQMATRELDQGFDDSWRKKGIEEVRRMQRNWLKYRDRVFSTIPYQLFLGVYRHDTVKAQARLLGQLVN